MFAVGGDRNKPAAECYAGRMEASPGWPRCGVAIRWALALGSLAILAGCGGNDGCAGFVTINATPPGCERLAEKFGCASFDASGPSCGLAGCARCNGETDQGSGGDFGATP